MSKKVKLLEQFLEEGLFDVVTKSKAFIKNPISATKITNNGKKLAQAEVDSAATDLDFEKRKLAASQAAKQKIEALKKKGDEKGAQKVKDDLTDSKDALKAAHDQKSDALTDKVASIKDRIDDLSKKNSSLQDLASLVKTAARVKKNEVLFKGADDEEKKQLKLQMKNDMEKIQGLQKGFGDYEGAKEPEDKAAKDKKSDVTVDTGDDKGATSSPSQPAAKSTAATPPPPPPPAAKTTTTQPAAKVDKASGDGTPEDKVRTARADLADAQRNMADAQRRVKDLDDKINNLKAGKYDKKTITDPKAEIASLEDQKKKAEARVEDTKADVEFTSAEADKAEKAFTASKEGKPKAEAPKAEAPKAEPKAEAPKAEAPKAEPKAEEPKTEAPKAEAPKAEPKAEAPKAEPKAEEPKTEAPKTEAPKAEAPKAEAPKADKPEKHGMTKAGLDSDMEKNLEARGKITKQIKDLEKELEWKSGDEEKAMKDKIESLKAERKKIDDEGEKLAQKAKDLEGDRWGKAAESFTTLKSFKDFVNEKKFSQKS